MQIKLMNLIKKYQNVKALEIKNQQFLNENIFGCIVSVGILDQVTISNFRFEETEFLGGHFHDCLFKNCKFHNSLLRKCKFWKCTFQNCEIVDCDISKVEFDDHTFDNCQFKNTNLEWSDLENCQFLGTELDCINFNATIISHLKIKND